MLDKIVDKIYNLFYKKKEIKNPTKSAKVVVCECGCPLFADEEMCPDCLRPHPYCQ